MIVWTKQFPEHEKFFAYFRLMKARLKYYDHLVLKRENFIRFRIHKQRGYRFKLRQLYNKYKKRRCFIIGNGPSLNKMNLSVLKNEITIGSNGIYKMFPKLGFHTDFILFEDVEQTELRRKKIPKIKGPIKILSLYNSYAIKNPKEDILFANVRGADKIYWEEESPMFSTDFAHIVYLGSTVTYLALQLAYYLGCNPVYLIGVDHSMKELRKHFGPGKIRITKKNYELIKKYHFTDEYYKEGDMVGIPYYEYQEQAYDEAKKIFENNNKMVLNAGVDSLLDIYDKVSFDSLF